MMWRDGSRTAAATSRRVNTHEICCEAFDRGIYRTRNLVERLMDRLKQFRRMATRYEKRAENYRVKIRGRRPPETKRAIGSEFVRIGPRELPARPARDAEAGCSSTGGPSPRTSSRSPTRPAPPLGFPRRSRRSRWEARRSRARPGHRRECPGWRAASPPGFRRGRPSGVSPGSKVLQTRFGGWFPCLSPSFRRLRWRMEARG